MITVVIVCFYFVSHGAQASVYGLEMLIMVSGVKKSISGVIRL